MARSGRSEYQIASTTTTTRARPPLPLLPYALPWHLRLRLSLPSKPSSAPPPRLPSPALLHATPPHPARPHLPLRSLKFTMSGMPSDDATGQVRPEGDISDKKVEETQDQNEGSGMPMPSPQEEEAAIKKKYGGVLPKKTPLISKDHERAYFDSADWALGKQGGNPSKPKGPLEALRPKLQPTQQHARARRTPYASADNDESLNLPAEDLSPNGDRNEDKSNKE